MSKANANQNWQLDILDLSGAELAQFEVIDIREPEEEPSVRHLFALLRTDVRSLPLSRFDADAAGLNKSRKYLFVCSEGFHSEHLVAELRKRGFNDTYSILGGVDAIRRKFIA